LRGLTGRLRCRNTIAPPIAAAGARWLPREDSRGFGNFGGNENFSRHGDAEFRRMPPFVFTGRWPRDVSS
jgi:hypothetical protein